MKSILCKSILSFVLSGCIALCPVGGEAFQPTEDPVLSRAIDQWLAKENSKDALADIGIIASKNNLAAQQFANGVFAARQTIGLGMSREELLELFPPEEEDVRVGRFRPYKETAELSPDLLISSDASTEQWIMLAESLIAKGYRQTVLANIVVAMNANRPGIENIFEFAAEHLTASDIHVIDFWNFVLSEKKRREHPKYKHTIPRLLIDPDALLQRTNFHKALDQGVWSAVTMAAAYLEDTRRDDHRVQLLSRTVRSSDPRSPHEDMRALGGVLLENLKQSPYLQPLFRFCNEVCRESTDQCMAVGVLSRVGTTRGAMYFEPFVDATRYYSSPRASDEIRANIANRLRHSPDFQFWEPMPQCLADEIRSIE